MQLSIELQGNAVSTWRGGNLSVLRAKQYSRFPVQVRFTDTGVVRDLGTGAEGSLVVKISGAVEDMAKALSWVKVGSGTKAYYVFDLNLLTAEINAWFAANPTKTSLTASLEINYVYGEADDRSATLSFELVRALSIGAAPAVSVNGVSGFRMWNAEQEQFQVLAITGAAGSETLEIRNETFEEAVAPATPYSALRLWNPTRNIFQLISIVGEAGVETISITNE